MQCSLGPSARMTQSDEREGLCSENDRRILLQEMMSERELMEGRMKTMTESDPDSESSEAKWKKLQAKREAIKRMKKEMDEMQCSSGRSGGSQGDKRPERIQLEKNRERPRDSLLQLICLQTASGSWTLTSTLEDVLGKSRDQVEGAMPAQVNQEVWATVLALIWLHGSQTGAQDEWQILATKAVSWLRAQKVSRLMECIEAGNALLGCEVQREALGLCEV